MIYFYVPRTVHRFESLDLCQCSLDYTSFSYLSRYKSLELCEYQVNHSKDMISFHKRYLQS